MPQCSVFLTGQRREPLHLLQNDSNRQQRVLLVFILWSYLNGEDKQLRILLVL